jgi:hypothetical protein
VPSTKKAILERYVTKTLDKAVALRCIKGALKNFSLPTNIVADAPQVTAAF